MKLIVPDLTVVRERRGLFVVVAVQLPQPLLAPTNRLGTEGKVVKVVHPSAE